MSPLLLPSRAHPRPPPDGAAPRAATLWTDAGPWIDAVVWIDAGNPPNSSAGARIRTGGFRLVPGRYVDRDGNHGTSTDAGGNGSWGGWHERARSRRSR